MCSFAMTKHHSFTVSYTVFHFSFPTNSLGSTSCSLCQKLPGIHHSSVMLCIQCHLFQGGTYPEPHTMARLFEVSRERDLDPTAHQHSRSQGSVLLSHRNQKLHGSPRLCSWLGRIALLKATPADAEQTNYKAGKWLFI